MKRWLKTEIQSIAEIDELSLNRVVVVALKEFVAKRSTENISNRLRAANEEVSITIGRS